MEQLDKKIDKNWMLGLFLKILLTTWSFFFSFQEQEQNLT